MANEIARAWLQKGHIKSETESSLTSVQMFFLKQNCVKRRQGTIKWQMEKQMKVCIMG